MQWQSSISTVLILTLIWLKISVTLSSNWSSETLSRIPCMSRLLHLLHRSYLFKSISNTEIWLFNFSVFWWSNEFFWQSASTMEFLILVFKIHSHQRTWNIFFTKNAHDIRYQSVCHFHWCSFFTHTRFDLKT